MGKLVQIDIVEGAEFKKARDGIEVVRMALVDGLDGNKETRLLDAIEVSGIPRKGEAHPTIPRIFVSNVTATPAESSEKALVKISYKSLEGFEQEPDETQLPVIEVGSTTKAARTNLYFDPLEGIKEIEVQYKRPKPSKPEKKSEFDKQSTFVDIQIPATTLKLSRKEPNSPLRKSKDFVGTVNITGILNEPKRVWLCTRIDGITTDGGESYEVSYEFQRAIGKNFQGEKISGWDAVVIYIDETTGKPPTDIRKTGQLQTNYEDFSLPAAAKIFPVYPATEFRELDLGVDLL